MNRPEFTEAIESYASGRMDRATWQKCFVAHCADGHLESARRDTVRMSVDCNDALSRDAQLELRAIAKRLLDPN